MRRLPAFTAATALTAAALVLTACTDASQQPAGSTGASDESSAEASFDPSTVKADEEIAAMVPAGIADDGQLTVGSNLEYAPVEFVGPDGKTAVGFDIDIIKAVATTMDLEADVQSSSFDAIIPGIGTRYEAGISAFTIDADRTKQVNMVSYFSAGSLFAVGAGNPQGIDVDDLCGAIVGVQTATIQQPELEGLSEGCEEDGKEPIEVVPYDSQADVTTNLAGGKLDAMYADSPVVAYAVEQAGGSIEAIGEVTDAAPYGVVVAKDDDELAAAVQAALQKLMDDGTLKEIADSWGNGDGALDKAEINPAG
jgi:polar amino acid transport system substrate-binding protein